VTGFHIDQYIRALDVTGLGTAGCSRTVNGATYAADELRYLLLHMRSGDRIVITLEEDWDAAAVHGDGRGPDGPDGAVGCDG
jgi:hypothetical protein